MAKLKQIKKKLKKDENKVIKHDKKEHLHLNSNESGIEELGNSDINQESSDGGESNLDENNDFSVEDVSNLEEDEDSNVDDGYDDDDSEDDVIESLEDRTSSKRKLQEDDQDIDKPIKKKAKRSKSKNVKPPTAAEMILLRETENLFQSNLFRLQIEEMLSELKPKKSVKRYIGPWIDNLKNYLLNLKEDEESHDLSSMDWLKDLDICLPVQYKKSEKGKGIFNFKPPTDVFCIGSHALGCPLGPFYSIDVAVIMPKSFKLHDDNLNQRYHIKRALYLCYLAGKLRNNDTGLLADRSSQFGFLCDDLYKPLLVLYPSGKLSKFISIHLYAVPEEKSFNYRRLLPSKNNIRPEWWGIEKDILPPTPMYNASILEDLNLMKNFKLIQEVFEHNQHLKDAFVLLRVWLKQRELCQGFGSFNSYITSMLLVYLMKAQKINKHMSSYQIIRHVWLYLADSDWSESGITLCDVKEEDAPEIDDFHIYYDLVFIDVTGYLNITAKLNKYIYQQVREESKLAIQHLDNHEFNGFKALFITKMPFIRQFDSVICLDNINSMNDIVKKKGDEVHVMDNNNVIPELLRLVTMVLERGVGHRLKSIGIQVSPVGVWDVNTYSPKDSHLMIGLHFNPAAAMSLIDKGPQANEPGAEEFREFWGEKCDLRRFKDGSVCESVVWEENNVSIKKRRSITNNIVLYLLKKKLWLPSVNIMSKCFEGAISPPKHLLPPPLEETCQKIHMAYEDISRKLRDLPDLPLSIVGVHCISPVYRFTEPFPPVQPQYCKYSTLINDPIKGRLFSPEGLVGKFYPEYIQPIDCVVQMALTQKWPDDVNAGKRLIAAFNIAISNSLKKHCNLLCQTTTEYFVVNVNGYIFRLYLGYAKEIGLLKLKISEEGVRQYRDTPESLALEKKFINLPKLTGALYRLSEEYPGFGSATCLAKQWFASQLLDETHFPSILIELLMAYTFVSPQPFSPCLNILPTFLRFLTLISSTDWSSTPIIVNFNSLLTGDDIKEIEDVFRENRSNLPPLFLATPYDKTGSLWSKMVPTLSTLVRLAKIAATTLCFIETNIIDFTKMNLVRSIFKPPMGVYDVVIHIKKKCQFRNLVKRWPERNPILPILGFNPVDLYLSELRENYSDFALFFHNPYGGIEIGVLFKPSYLESIKFQSSMVNGRKPVLENGQITLKPNLDSIFEGFKILGNGIVYKIDFKKMKSDTVQNSEVQ